MDRRLLELLVEVKRRGGATSRRDVMAGAEMTPIAEDQMVFPSGVANPNISPDRFETPAPGLAGSMVTGPSPEFREGARAGLPALGAGAASTAFPPSAPILYPAAAAGVGAAGGELGRQQLAGEELDIGEAASVGGQTAAGTFAFGALFRFLFPGKSAIASNTDRAVKYARDNNLPMPAGAVSKMGKLAEGVGRLTASGDVGYAQQLNRIAQSIDDHIAKMGFGAHEAIETTVARARDLLRDRFNVRAGYQQIADKIGRDTPIDLRGTLTSLKDRITELRRSGNSAVRAEAEEILAAFEDTGNTVYTFDKVDGLMTKLQKLASPDVYDDTLAIIGSLRDDIQRSIESNPQIMAALGDVPVREIFAQAGQNYNALRKALKASPELRKIVGGGDMSPGQFFVKWSGSKAARDAVKAVDEEAYNMLNQSWIAAAAERSPRGGKFLGFIQKHSDTVKDMFGDDGLETLENFGYYLKAIEKYSDPQAVEKLLTQPASLAGRVATETYAMGAVPTVIAEVGGYPLITALMTGGTQLNSLFSTAGQAVQRGAVPAAAAGIAGAASNTPTLDLQQ